MEKDYLLHGLFTQEAIVRVTASSKDEAITKAHEGQFQLIECNASDPGEQFEWDGSLVEEVLIDHWVG